MMQDLNLHGVDAGCLRDFANRFQAGASTATVLSTKGTVA